MRAIDWMRTAPRRCAAVAVLAAAGMASACGDFLAEPADAPARLSISYALEPGAPPALQTGASRAFDRVDEVRVRLTRGEAVVLEQTLAAAPGDSGVIRTTLEIELDGAEEELSLAVALHGSGHALFTGAQSVRLARGRQASAQVTLAPVADQVRVAATPVVEALGDTVPLGAAVLFASGDTVPGVPVAWSTLDPAIVQMISGARLVALAEGTARVVATHGSLTAQGTVQVRGRVVSVAVTPAVDSILVGDSVRLVAVARDRRGNALTGRTVAWSGGGAAATVTAGGVVRGTANGTAHVTATVEGQTGQASVEVMTPARIYGAVRNLQTLAPLAGATVTLAGPGAGQTRTVQPNAQGAYSLGSLRPGSYALSAAASGFTGNTAALRVTRLPAGDVLQVVFDLPPTSAGQPVGGVAGRVTTPQGAPISGATVMISGGTLTNGVFRSVLTAADGTYSLPGIALRAANGQIIPSFSVIAAGNGLATQRRDTMALSGGQTRANVDFVMPPGPAVQTYFTDGFEDASLAWQVTGMWNRTTGVGIVNTAVPSQADLAPDDTAVAVLPQAPEGTRYLWYGTPATGNYLGSGTNSGAALSPAFVVPAGVPSASLTFRTWFEIESVNPNAQGFDIMTVSVVDVAAGTTTELVRLNPFVDPNLANRQRIPFTSGGFNRAPVFRPVTVDLSAYTGRQIRLRFSFNTVDGLYNYFRGWIVDDVRVTSAPAALGEVRAGPPPTARGRCTLRCGRPRP